MVGGLMNRRTFLALSAFATGHVVTVRAGARELIQQAERAPHARSEAANVVTLFLCGDVMTGRGIDQILPHPSDPRLCERFVPSALGYVELAERANGRIPRPVDFAYVWGDALAAWQRVKPDVKIVNLETSVTTSGECLPKGINYRMNPDNIGCLTAAAIDCCALANNHVLDWGRAGLDETLETLRASGIRTAGAGGNLEEAIAPAVFNLPDKGRVLVFSYGHTSSGIPSDWAATPTRSGVNLLHDLSDSEVERVAEEVRAAKQANDIVVASIHWGGNWGYEVPAGQKSLARRLIDRAGVDVVHGHSSHHAKGIEVYRNKLILYGCGDFLTDYEGITGYEEFRDDLVVMYFAHLAPESGALVGLSMVPLQLKTMRLNRPSESDVIWLRDTLNREGERFGTRVERTEDGTLQLRWI